MAINQLWNSRSQTAQNLVDAFDRRLLLIFFIPFAVYMANLRHIDSGDTTPTIFVAIFTVKHGTVFLDSIHNYIPYNQIPYFLSERHGRIVSNYPIFPGLMAAPFYAPFIWMGMISPGDGNLVWDYISKITASTYTALAVLLTYLTLRRLLSKGQALGLSYSYAFGTALWPIASQSLWQHTGSVFWWSAALYALVRFEQEDAPVRKNLLLALCGAAVGCAVLCRINNLLGAAIFFAVVLWRTPWRSGWFTAPMAALIGALIAYNLLLFESWQGGVTEVLELRWHLDRVEGGVWTTPLLEGLAGVLFSPSRGVFVFSPFLLVSLIGMALIWRRPEPEWRVLAPLTLAAPVMLAALAKYIVWWGGIMHYGPRYPIDAYPFLIIATAAVWPLLCNHRWLRGLLIILILFSAWVQWTGAFCYPGQWAVHPVSLSEDKDRLWDWGYNQIWDSFLSGIKAPWT